MKNGETDRQAVELMRCGRRHGYFVECKDCEEAMLDVEPIGIDQIRPLLTESLAQKPEPRILTREEWRAQMAEVLPPTENRAA